MTGDGWGATLLGAVAAMAWLGGPMPLLPDLHATAASETDRGAAPVPPPPEGRSVRARPPRRSPAHRPSLGPRTGELALGLTGSDTVGG